MIDTTFVRALRTSSSERHIVRAAGLDIGALDIHYLTSGMVQATLVLFEGSGFSEGDVPSLLSHIDEVLLPEAALDTNDLIFTVVIGRVLGAFEAEGTQANSEDSVNG